MVILHGNQSIDVYIICLDISKIKINLERSFFLQQKAQALGQHHSARSTLLKKMSISQLKILHCSNNSWSVFLWSTFRILLYTCTLSVYLNSSKKNIQSRITTIVHDASLLFLHLTKCQIQWQYGNYAMIWITSQFSLYKYMKTWFQITFGMSSSILSSIRITYQIHEGLCCWSWAEQGQISPGK